MTGIDIAPTAVDAANVKFSSNPMISCHLQDFFTIQDTPLAGKFDGIWEHTCFCAIPPTMRSQYVTAAAVALKPNGLLLACFYLNPWDPEEDQTQGPPFGTSLAELEHLFAKYFDFLDSKIPEFTFPGREGKEVIQLLKKR